MKPRLFVLCLIFPLFLACHSDSGSSVFTPTVPIVGSGVIVSEDRFVPPFNGVDLRAFAAVTISEGASQSVRIETDDNIIDHIGTRVSGSVLVIDSDTNYNSLHGVKLFLTATDVRSLQLTGVGSISASDINSTGTVRATQSGSGTITLSGTADALSGTLTGVGGINAQALATRHSTIVISGQGDCRVTATDELDVTITGIGDVYYAGNPPLVRSTITGLGRLIAI